MRFVRYWRCLCLCCCCCCCCRKLEMHLPLRLCAARFACLGVVMTAPSGVHAQRTVALAAAKVRAHTTHAHCVRCCVQTKHSIRFNAANSVRAPLCTVSSAPNASAEARKTQLASRFWQACKARLPATQTQPKPPTQKERGKRSAHTSHAQPNETTKLNAQCCDCGCRTMHCLWASINIYLPPQLKLQLHCQQPHLSRKQTSAASVAQSLQANKLAKQSLFCTASAIQS